MTETGSAGRMMAHQHDEDIENAERAEYISAEVCDCPAIHVVLYDSGHIAYAIGTLTPEQWRMLRDGVDQQLADKMIGGQVAGHG